MQRAFGAVALIALACLLLRAARVGVAGDYVDPISRISAQDEASYAHTAIHMAREGEWLTPYLMGRLALYKPPALFWAAGLGARIAGVWRLSLRFPVALAASLALGLIFLWVAEVRSWQAGACAAVLLASNHLWHVLGGMCLTDGLLAAFFVAAMYCLFSDPWLESRWALWGYSAAVAAAILTKSVAGLMPLGALGLYWLAAPPKQRPTFLRVCLAGALALGLAAPWFGYQAMVHHRWFMTEHIYTELLGFGAGAPPQTTQENQAAFYLLRLPGIDPVLIAFALVAMPGFVRELRRRSGEAVLLGCWMVVVVAGIFAFQYRNIAYTLPLLPALAILAAAYGPYTSGRRNVMTMLGLLVVLFAAKAAFPAAPWGLSFRAGTIQPVAPLVSDYCRQGRGNELVLVGMDDDLYASVLPLARLRYSLVGGSFQAGRYNLPFDQMGIVITAAQFNDLARWTPAFRDRLRQWGVDSDEPIGTLILASSPGEIAEMVRRHPESDFLVPESYRSDLAGAANGTHVQVDARGHIFLLSRTVVLRRERPGWTCGL